LHFLERTEPGRYFGRDLPVWLEVCQSIVDETQIGNPVLAVKDYILSNGSVSSTRRQWF
jgi:hypothetical protein